ncbi:hypothetical protein DC3_12760 [Deinococcus cellulosilyticus NBRC 106333 = KACC 11606]|uniref:Uncharacterized protein n=1 Tax=Deinococcus cellulosilyticus (strain DSM 18568 / NBRC 106333 / KACC 11606 / 5516J-15) TaxID=1223518 RepID=A0A511MZ91_DEIC1|nr:hypothetical protein DC3_12760 [Deinococcus cellulosilyticus NBRC 106333 = KACC 11606]
MFAAWLPSKSPDIPQVPILGKSPPPSSIQTTLLPSDPWQLWCFPVNPTAGENTSNQKKYVRAYKYVSNSKLLKGQH